MKVSFFENAPKFPVLVQPDGPDAPVKDPDALRQWAAENPEWIEEQLTEHGAILFRDYGFTEAEQFQAFVLQISPTTLSYARAANPRKQVLERVYTSTEASRFVPIPLHSDMSSYGKTTPAKIFFFCQQPSAKGGHTPMADLYEVYDSLGDDIKRDFEEKGLKMIQNVPRKLGLRNIGATRTWMSMFETEDRKEVEQFCEKQGIGFQWKRDGSIQVINPCAASVKHPKTGRKTWLNAAHMFYPTWAEEMWHTRRYGATLIIGTVEALTRRLVDPLDRVNHVTYLDGTEIPRDYIRRIRQAFWDHTAMFDWKQGDVVVVDNLRMAHGRMPYRGKRRILAMITEPWLKSSGYDETTAKALETFELAAT